MRKERVFSVLPTMLTLGNLVCGFGSITFASKVGLKDQWGWVANDSDYLFVAGLLVFLAMVFDALDGRAARWAKQSSQFGAELDSLCDAVSFGVAPAFLLVKFSPDFHPRLLWVIAVLFVVCAVLRLARFNVETEEEDSHEFFSGLPSPAAAAVASFMIAYPELEARAAPLTGQPNAVEQYIHNGAAFLIPAVRVCLPIITLCLACLMVSRIRYPHVFNQWFRGKRSYQHIVQLVIGAAAVFLVQELAVPLICCYFALGSPLRAVWTRATVRRPAQPVTPHVDGDHPVQLPPV